MVFYLYFILFFDILVVIIVTLRIMSGTVEKMNKTREINLLIKSMNDYHFERSNKMPFLILHMTHHIKIINILI